MTTALSTWCRLALLATACLLCAATAAPEGGERTNDCFLLDSCDPQPDGGGAYECIPGELCSPQTPEGLYFGSVPFGDDWLFTVAPPPTIAVGGTLSVTLYPDSYAESPFMLPYEATTDAELLEVTDATPPGVSLRGNTAGSAHLRVVEPDTGLLYDRLLIDVAAVNGAYLTFTATESILPSDDLPLLLVGVSHPLVLALTDADGERLADETATLSLPEGWSDMDPRWDVFEALPSTAGPYTFEVSAGDRSFSVTAEAVDTIDNIARLDSYTDIYLSAQEGREFCFLAELGERTVLTNWEFYGIGGIELEQSDRRGCIVAHGTAVGSGTLIAGSAGIELRVELQVHEAAGSAGARHSTVRPARSANAAGGERVAQP